MKISCDINALIMKVNTQKKRQGQQEVSKSKLKLPKLSYDFEELKEAVSDIKLVASLRKASSISFSSLNLSKSAIAYEDIRQRRGSVITVSNLSTLRSELQNQNANDSILSKNVGQELGKYQNLYNSKLKLGYAHPILYRSTFQHVKGA